MIKNLKQKVKKAYETFKKIFIKFVIKFKKIIIKLIPILIIYFILSYKSNVYATSYLKNSLKNSLTSTILENESENNKFPEKDANYRLVFKPQKFPSFESIVNDLKYDDDKVEQFKEIFKQEIELKQQANFRLTGFNNIPDKKNNIFDIFKKIEPKPIVAFLKKEDEYFDISRVNSDNLNFFFPKLVRYFGSEQVKKEIKMTHAFVQLCRQYLKKAGEIIAKKNPDRGIKKARREYKSLQEFSDSLIVWTNHMQQLILYLKEFTKMENEIIAAHYKAERESLGFFYFWIRNKYKYLKKNLLTFINNPKNNKEKIIYLLLFAIFIYIVQNNRTPKQRKTNKNKIKKFVQKITKFFGF